MLHAYTVYVEELACLLGMRLDATYLWSQQFMVYTYIDSIVHNCDEEFFSPSCVVLSRHK